LPIKLINIDRMLCEDIPIQFGGKKYIIKSAIPGFITEEFLNIAQELADKDFMVDYELGMKYLQIITKLFQANGHEVTFEELKQSGVSVSQIVLLADLIIRLMWFRPDDVLTVTGEIKKAEKLLTIRKQKIQPTKKKKK